ncbi:MAG: cytochrome C [Acidobacteriota bacterium]|nr:cytochrome C [Acidobacteriota bacterium]
MSPNPHLSHNEYAAGVIAIVAAASLALARDVPGPVADCLTCHDDPSLTLQLEDGEELNLHVTAATFLESVHGEGGLVCSDCHAGYGDDHPFGKSFASKRAYVLGAYETCKECHFDTYTRTLESVHYELARQGLDIAPVCTDCHGAHDVHDPHAKSPMIDRSCGVCHAGVYEDYAASAHGRALVEEGLEDVPGCADCHESHSIEYPSTARFRVSSPEKCIECHGDEQLMEPYGLSTYVATSYLADFHGVTASLSSDEDGDPRQVVVTCVDCHGHHGIASPREVGEEPMKAIVAATCSKCHADAPVDFPAAWLSHYEPSLSHAPLVYLVNLFYWIFIPFVVAGLALQVLLHLLRVASGR